MSTTTQVIASTANNGMYTLLSYHGTWLTARSGNGSRFQYPEVIIGTDFFQNEHDCYQAFLQFNTSSIPSGATITSAVLSMFIEESFSNATSTARVRKHDSWSYNLQNSHFVPGANLSGITLSGSLNLSASLTGWIDIPLSAETITKAGTTRLLVHESRQESSTSPGTTERYKKCTGPSGNADRRPRLVITYTEETTLPAPSNFTFEQISGLRTVVGEWDAVSGITHYDWEVQVRSGNRWQAHWSNWTVNTFFDLTNANGNIQWNTRYRARVKATPPAPAVGTWSNWVELTTSLEPGAQDLQIFRFVNGSLVPVDIFRGAPEYVWAIGQPVTTPPAP